MRYDKEWADAAARYQAAAHAAQIADDEKTAAREELLRLSAGENCAGFGVSLCYQERKSAIDYKTIAETVCTVEELEKARKPATKAVIIKVIEGE